MDKVWDAGELKMVVMEQHTKTFSGSSRQDEALLVFANKAFTVKRIMGKCLFTGSKAEKTALGTGRTRCFRTAAYRLHGDLESQAAVEKMRLTPFSGRLLALA